MFCDPFGVGADLIGKPVVCATLRPPANICDPYRGRREGLVMGSTYLSLHYHITFSTKERRPWIAPEWRARFHEYLGGTVRGLDGVPQSIGGVEDHIHFLIGLRASHTLADFVRELKKAATAWVREQGLEPAFAWQEGYAAFTVSPTARPQVKSYISNQEEHHRQRSYVDELKALLDAAQVEYDPKYLE